MALPAGIDEDQLRELYVDRGLSGPQIAARLGVGRQTVYNRLDELGIRRRPAARVRADVDRDTLFDLYARKKLGVQAIAEQMGVGPSVVERRLREFGIPMRRPGKSQEDNPHLTAKALRKSYEVDKLPLSGIAALAGVSTVTVWKYLGKHGITPRTRQHVQQVRNQVEPGTITARRVDADGYVILSIWTGKFTRRVSEHRYVMEQAIGRLLESDESVHHKDTDHGNNALSNLQLRRGSHGRGGALQCIDCGGHNIVAVNLADPDAA
jgi:hypothetical protein